MTDFRKTRASNDAAMRRIREFRDVASGRAEPRIPTSPIDTESEAYEGERQGNIFSLYTAGETRSLVAVLDSKPDGLEVRMYPTNADTELLRVVDSIAALAGGYRHGEELKVGHKLGVDLSKVTYN